MGFELLKRKSLWTPSGNLGAVASGDIRWLLNSNAISSNTATIPANTGFHNVETHGADMLILQWAFNLTSVTHAGGTVTTSNLRLQTLCEPFTTGVAPYVNALAAAGYSGSSPSVQAQQVGASIITPSNITAATLRTNQNNTASSLDDHFICIGDGTIAANNDRTFGFVYVTAPPQNNTTLAATNLAPLSMRISPMQRVWVAAAWLPVLGGASITAITIEGSLDALFYREVIYTRRADGKAGLSDRT